MLRLNEHYTSIQGEGLRVGTLTQFVRFSGCNMRCPGWPCDTPHAIFPEQWKDDPKLDPGWLAEKIQEEFQRYGAKNICFTGGEPFMQKHDDIIELIELLHRWDVTYSFEFFTNGSYPFPNWIHEHNTLIMMDWKLRGSGEADTRLAERLDNAKKLTYIDGIKFVCKNYVDFSDAVRIAKQLRMEGVTASYWLGCAWGASEAVLVDWLKGEPSDVGFRINVQLHKYLWPDQDRGI